MFNAKKAITEIAEFLNGNAWTTLNSHVWYKKRCGLVFLRLTNGQSMQLTKSGTTLGTLPAGYRPAYQFDIAGTALGGAESVFFRVNTNGTIIGFASSSTVYWSGLVCFPLVGGGYCLNGLKAVFSMLSAITERWWRDAERKEGTDKTHPGYVQRRRPIASYQPWESRRSNSNAGRLACCTGGNGQWRVNRAHYPSDGWRENCRRANRHHLCWLGGVSVLRGEKGRILHHNHIQVLTNCGVAVLGSYVGGCL